MGKTMTQKTKAVTIATGIRQLPNNKFEVSAMCNGQRRTKVVARFEDAKLLYAEFKAGNDYVEHVHNYEPYSFSKGWDLYEHMRTRAKKAKGKTVRRSDFTWMRSAILEHFGADTLLDSISPALVLGFADAISDRPASTINELGSCLYQIQHKAFQRGHMRTLPIRIERVPNVEGRLRYLTDQEQRQFGEWLLANAGYEYWALFKFYIATGARAAEGRDIEWSDINLDTGQVTFWGNRTKSSKSRSVPISKDTRQLLAQLAKQSNHSKVFPTITYAKFNALWNQMKQSFGLQSDTELVVHALRHTFGTEMAAAGYKMPDLAALMGHSNINTTYKYVHFQPQAYDEAMRIQEQRAQLANQRMN
jgi:integrase